MFDQVVNNNRSALNLQADFDESVHDIYIPNGAPYFDPDFGGKLYEKLNCYSYALNLDKHGWGRPGQLLLQSGMPLGVSINKESIHFKLLSDGLVQASKNKEHFNKHIIVAVINPNSQFHFYRLDSDGGWSCGGGYEPVRKLERKIINPSKDFTNKDYPVFVGLYEVPKTGIAYYPRLAME